MSAALCALYEVIQEMPSAYRNLTPSFVSILKQVCSWQGWYKLQTNSGTSGTS